LGFGVRGLGFGVWGLWFVVWGLRFDVCGLWFVVWGLRFEVVGWRVVFSVSLISRGKFSKLRKCRPVSGCTTT